MDNGEFGLVNMIDFNKEEIGEIKRKNWIDGIIFDCLYFTEEEMEYFLDNLVQRIDEEIFTIKDKLDELLKIKSVVDIKIKQKES